MKTKQEWRFVWSEMRRLQSIEWWEGDFGFPINFPKRSKEEDIKYLEKLNQSKFFLNAKHCLNARNLPKFSQKRMNTRYKLEQYLLSKGIKWENCKWIKIEKESRA